MFKTHILLITDAQNMFLIKKKKNSKFEKNVRLYIVVNVLSIQMSGYRISRYIFDIFPIRCVSPGQLWRNIRRE